MPEEPPLRGRLVSSALLMRGGTLRPNQYIFFVFREGDWKIQRREGLSARYRTQQEALLDALHCARKAGKRGEVVESFWNATSFRSPSAAKVWSG